MRASPRISVLCEGGDPCIAGNGPSEDHKIVIFPWDGFPFHWWLLMCVILTTVAGWATATFLLQQETVVRGDPLILDNRDSPFLGSVRKSLCPVWPVLVSRPYCLVYNILSRVFWIIHLPLFYPSLYCIVSQINRVSASVCKCLQVSASVGMQSVKYSVVYFTVEWNLLQ